METKVADQVDYGVPEMKPKLILRQLGPQAYEWVCGDMKWPESIEYFEWPIMPGKYVIVTDEAAHD